MTPLTTTLAWLLSQVLDHPARTIAVLVVLAALSFWAHSRVTKRAEP